MPRVSTRCSTSLPDGLRHGHRHAAGSACRSANGSGSAWPACWARRRRCCCWTSRPRTWTPHLETRVLRRHRRRGRAPARRWSWSVTASRCWRSAIGWCTWRWLALARAMSLLDRCWPCSRPRCRGCCWRSRWACCRSAARWRWPAVAAWLITRAWQMPPVLDLTVAVVAVRALGISRGVFGYCERLASHDTALRAAGNARARAVRRLANGPADAAMRLHSGELVPAPAHRSTNSPMCWCGRCCRSRWPPCWGWPPSR